MMCLIKEMCSTDSRPLLIFRKNICGLRKKNSLFPKFPHILCFSENYLKQIDLEQINLEGINLVLHTVGNLY
jgi:hypothetical protein